MVDYWEKGLPIRIADDSNGVEGSIHSIDLARAGRLLLSSPPQCVMHDIISSILVDNMRQARSLVMSDDPFLSDHHHGSVYYSHDAKTKTAMMGLMAAIAQARMDSFKSMGMSGISEYRGRIISPMWNIIGLFTEIDDVISNEDWSKQFVEYARNLSANCISSGVYVIFCSKLHGFSMSEQGKKLLQMMPIVGSSAVSNQAVSHALGFYSSIKSPEYLYMKGDKFGDLASLSLKKLRHEDPELLPSLATQANYTLDQPEVANSVDKIQAEVFERAWDFLGDPPDTPKDYREELRVPINGFYPKQLVSRLMFVLGSYGIDKQPSVNMIAGHMSLTEEQTIEVLHEANRKYAGSANRVKGYH